MPTVETSGERRIFERFSARFPTKFKDARSDFGTEVYLRDASASGVRIVTRERFFLDNHVALEVELPDGGAPLTINGRVTWTRPMNAAMWDVGLQFANIDFMKMHRLFKFTEAHSNTSDT